MVVSQHKQDTLLQSINHVFPVYESVSTTPQRTRLHLGVCNPSRSSNGQHSDQQTRSCLKILSTGGRLVSVRLVDLAHTIALGLHQTSYQSCKLHSFQSLGGGGARQMKVAIIGTYRSRGSDRVAKIGTDLGGVDDEDR